MLEEHVNYVLDEKGTKKIMKLVEQRIANGAYFIGYRFDGQPHGTCTIKFEDGSVFTGIFNGYQRSELGTLTHLNDQTEQGYIEEMKYYSQKDYLDHKKKMKNKKFRKLLRTLGVSQRRIYGSNFAPDKSIYDYTLSIDEEIEIYNDEIEALKRTKMFDEYQENIQEVVKKKEKNIQKLEQMKKE